MEASGSSFCLSDHRSVTAGDSACVRRTCAKSTLFLSRFWPLSFVFLFFHASTHCLKFHFKFLSFGFDFSLLICVPSVFFCRLFSAFCFKLFGSRGFIQAFFWDYFLGVWYPSFSSSCELSVSLSFILSFPASCTSVFLSTFDFLSEFCSFLQLSVEPCLLQDFFTLSFPSIFLSRSFSFKGSLFWTSLSSFYSVCPRRHMYICFFSEFVISVTSQHQTWSQLSCSCLIPGINQLNSLTLSCFVQKFPPTECSLV